MSFINKALEKAKSLHHKEGEPAGPPLPEQRPGAVPPPPPPPPVFEEFMPRGETPEEIEYKFTRKVEVDMELLRHNRLIVEGMESTVGEAYKLLRTHILHRTKAEGRNTLMFTGPLPNEGKTLTTINLGISISQKVGQTVLLVDGDLRSPSIHRYLDLPSGPGLIDHLTSGYPISDCLVHPVGLADLVVLPAGKSTPDAGELLSSPLMVDLVRELKHFYPDRYVLFDLPPLTYADPLAFAPLVDGIILVVEANETPREEIIRSLEMLKQFPILGFIMNKVDMAPQAYDDAYRYYGEQQPSRSFKLPWSK